MLAPRTMKGLLDIAAVPSASISASAREKARLSLYDWFTVMRAGENEPVAKIVRGFVADEGGKEAASVAGLDKMVPARAAALANGVASHALDYDDTHFAHVGHPSVAILPAALAVGEEIDAPASAALDALLIGAEASIRIGIVLGASPRRMASRRLSSRSAALSRATTVSAGRRASSTRMSTKPTRTPPGRRRPLRPSCSRTSSTSCTPAAMACTRRSRRCDGRGGRTRLTLRP
jgi:2-methylcitrate dehydratase PrpD